MQQKSIIKQSLSDFAGDKKTRLALYGQPGVKSVFKRKGTSFEKKSMSPEEVVDVAQYFAMHPDEWTETHAVNESEEFARYCKERTTKAIPVVESCLKPGDHICVRKFCLPRSDALYLYTHHGIYIGENEVVHFSGNRTSDKKTAKIRRGSLQSFKGGAQNIYRYGRKYLFIKALPSGEIVPIERLDSKRIVRLANYYANNPQKWPRYDLLRNNCEFFAFDLTLGGMLSPKIFQHQMPVLVPVFHFLTDNIHSLLEFLSSNKLLRRLLQNLCRIFMEASEAILNKPKVKELMTYLSSMSADAIPQALDISRYLPALPY